MLDDNADRGGTDHLGRLHILRFPQLHELAAHLAGRAAPGGDAHGKQQAAHVLAHHHHDEQGNEQGGERGDDLNNTHHHAVHGAAKVSHGTAIGAAHHDLDGGADQCHDEGQPGADPDTAEDITAHGVGAKPVGTVRSRILDGRVDLDVLLAADGGAQQHEEEDHGQHHHGDDSQRVLLESAPRALPVGDGGTVDLFRVKAAVVHPGCLLRGEEFCSFTHNAAPPYRLPPRIRMRGSTTVYRISVTKTTMM